MTITAAFLIALLASWDTDDRDDSELLYGYKRDLEDILEEEKGESK